MQQGPDMRPDKVVVYFPWYYERRETSMKLRSYRASVTWLYPKANKQLISSNESPQIGWYQYSQYSFIKRITRPNRYNKCWFPHMMACHDILFVWFISLLSMTHGMAIGYGGAQRSVNEAEHWPSWSGRPLGHTMASALPRRLTFSFAF